MSKTPHLQRLSTILDCLSDMLLKIPVDSERELFVELRKVTFERDRKQNYNGEGCLLYCSEPAVLMSTAVMGRSHSHGLEIALPVGTVGLTMVTNYNYTDDAMNRFIEIVPTYFKEGKRVSWFYQKVTPIMEYQLARHIAQLVVCLEDKFNVKSTEDNTKQTN